MKINNVEILINTANKKGEKKIMFMHLEIETYQKNGKKYVFIAADGASGCEYEYKDDIDFAEIVGEYASDILLLEGTFDEDEETSEDDEESLDNEL